MKRLWVILILCTFLLGCSTNSAKKPAAFYYPPHDYVLTQDGSILDSEVRETIQEPNMASVLNLYMRGPQNPRFLNPFPADCTVVSLRHYGDTLELVLSNELAQLTGIDLPLACACLAKTSMELTGAQTVKIRTHSSLLAGGKEMVFTPDTLNISSHTFGGNDSQDAS